MQIVGQGTPAAQAGIQPGDLIKKLNGVEIADQRAFDRELQKTKAGQTIPVELVRDGKEMTVSVTLTRRPMEVVRPENAQTVPEPMTALYADKPAPLSFLMTLKQVDNQKLADFEETPLPAEVGADWPRPKLGAELKGVNLRDGNWEVVSKSASEAVFSRQVPQWGLEIRKIFRLVEVPGDEATNPDFKAYHLIFNVEIRNHSPQPHKVAYQLDGPNGLPLEGYWYASKIGTGWGAVGLRDVVVSFKGGKPALIGAPNIAIGSVEKPYQGDPLSFVGVDAQYFSSILIPQTEQPEGRLVCQHAAAACRAAQQGVG